MSKKRTVAAKQRPGNRCIILTRLSKEKDNVPHQSQESGCRAWAAARQMDVVAVEKDDDLSGDLLNRPGLWRSVERIRQGEADVLLVYSLDRLARGVMLQGHIIYSIRSSGGQVASATEQVGEGALGDVQLSLYGFAAQSYVETVRAKTRAALDARFRATGKYKPGRRTVYGYARLGTGADATCVQHPDEAAVVVRIYTLTAAGHSRRQIVSFLNADHVAGPTGGQWAVAAVAAILNRSVYATGRHECGKTRIVRDGSGVAYPEPTPLTDRYVAEFPPLIDADLAAAAAAAAERNVWKSRRADRPGDVGLLRYGFVRCGACGHPLSVTPARKGGWRYACTNAGQGRCAAPTTITLDRMDGPVWNWVRAVLSDPAGGTRWVYRPVPPANPDPAALAALVAAEAKLGDLTSQVDTLTDNLTRATGRAADLLLARLNALGADLDAATADRDRLAAGMARERARPEPMLLPTDAIGRAVAAAILAMRTADPHPVATETILLKGPLHPDLPVPTGLREQESRAGREIAATMVLPIPATWAARQACLSRLGVAVTVSRPDSGAPRWTATMRLADGAAMAASSATPWPPVDYVCRTRG